MNLVLLFLFIGCVVSATMTCGYRHGCCDSWSSQRRNSRDVEHVVVEAQNTVGGRLGAADGQVDTQVLVRTDKW